MSTIFSTSTNITMYQLIGAFPKANTENLFEIISERLSRFAFQDITETADEFSAGWVQTDDSQATAFSSPAFTWVDNFLFFSLRYDSRKVPAANLKQEISDREAAWLEDKPNFRRPPKQVRAEIKESAKLALLIKTLPVPKVFDAVIDMDKSVLYLLTTSRKEVDLFEKLLPKTFEGYELHLVPFVPYTFATDILKPHPILVEKLAAANQATTGHLIDLMKSNLWIGTGFLLWLVSGQTETILPDISAWIDDRIVLTGAGEDGNPQKVVLTGALGERMATLKSAIRDGKRISEATIYFEDGNSGYQWRFTLDALTFNIKSMKCPPVKVERGELADDTSERQGVMLFRIATMQDAINDLSSCLYLFLADRLQDQWATVDESITEWLEG